MRQTGTANDPRMRFGHVETMRSSICARRSFGQLRLFHLHVTHKLSLRPLESLQPDSALAASPKTSIITGRIMRAFQPECTFPEEGPAFIQQPNVRSTMDIIWNSLTIMLLCTWCITYLTVPPQLRPLPPAKSFWEGCRRGFFETWYPFSRKAR